MREIADQNNSEHGYFLRSEYVNKQILKTFDLRLIYHQYFHF